MKKLIALLLALLMVFSLVACGAKEEAPAAKEEAKTEAPKVETKEEAKVEDVVLKVAAFEGGYGATVWENLSAAFEASHPGVKVELTTNPKIEDIVRPQIVAGDSPDIFYPNGLTNTLYRALLNEGKLLDLSDIFAQPGVDDDAILSEQLLDGFLTSSACDPGQNGEIYSAPISVCTRGLIYNKTLFDENGWEVPETWDEFFALGDKAKEKGIALLTYAGTYPDYLDSLTMPALASAIGPEKVLEMSQFTEGILTLPEATQVFENVARIGAEGYLLEGTVGMNHTQSQSEFILNKALFCPNGDWLAEEMADAPHAEGFEYACCPAPVLKAGQTQYTRSSPEVICVPAEAKNPELAKEFIRFLYTDEAVKIFAQDANMLQCTKDAVALTEGLFTKEFSAIHEVDNYATALVFSWAPDADGSRIVISDEVYNPVADVMTGKMTGIEWRDAIETAFQRINAGE